MPEPDRNQTIAAAVREELARRRMSRAELAVQSRISLSSLEKALSGQRPFTGQTLVRLEDALNLRLRPQEERGPVLAPEWLGSYARPAVQWIEGEYLTLRPSASDIQGLYAYLTTITWDADASHLVFRESGRLDTDFTQWGAVSVPHQTGHIYLVTNRHGQHRLAVLARPTVTGEMFGLLTTLQTGRGAHLTPASMPLALIPTAKLERPLGLGKIDRDHPRHPAYRGLLSRAADDHFVLMHPAPRN